MFWKNMAKMNRKLKSEKGTIDTLSWHEGVATAHASLDTAVSDAGHCYMMFLSWCKYLVNQIKGVLIIWNINGSVHISFWLFSMMSAGMLFSIRNFESSAPDYAGILLCKHPANERRCYNVTASLIGQGAYTKLSVCSHHPVLYQGSK